MKKSLLAIMATCFLLVFAITSSQAFAGSDKFKVATISIQKVLATSTVALAAQAKVQAQVQTLQGKFKSDEDELTALKSDIEKKSSVWSDEVRAEKERDYKKKMREYGLKTEDAKFEVQQLEKKVMEPILKVLHDVIGDLGKKNGYTMILENTMKGLRNRTGLLYADETLDISEMVRKEIDARLKK